MADLMMPRSDIDLPRFEDPLVTDTSPSMRSARSERLDLDRAAIVRSLAEMTRDWVHHTWRPTR